jgi:shikimate kinase
MKLIFIYGPPAVGKTTIGAGLAKTTGYKFFFNHLTVPAAKAIFPDADSLNNVDGYHTLLQKLRVDGITAAAENGLNIIFTVAYSGTVDDGFVSQIVDAVTARGGEIHFVQLSAPPQILAERVGNHSRSDLQLGKMTDPEHLRKTLSARDMYASVKYPDILKIDTSETEPEPAAKHIIEHFGL